MTKQVGDFYHFSDTLVKY